MRMFIAALLGATAYLPALVHAMPIFPDPADAAVSVPAVEVPSALADYRPYREQQTTSWQALNRAVTNPSDGAGMSHGTMHSGVDSGVNPGIAEAKDDAHGSHHEGAAK
ncbi:hypothetical protein BCh11DRAFT_01027 [Burkholderia sp. Ch1-1]|uniref:Uncharacterized protein n=1 Tax=Paraburkholderia dioscoreae TaxID=2604047 RepID=A0A5Q4ZKD8_9BURK|nr:MULTISPECIES: hypothetical protein [Paraburkholderia]EIF33262.1 hypothetical protein BCh11DRAFT_01027 [Burkholderia sp. Ch1-1]MDR8395966.1 hypothetical protein [Paraburkholderia sp. USG1]VVD32096.1 conserved exported protein of unknown function [Paraburkholderia dioscoreae]